MHSGLMQSIWGQRQALTSGRQGISATESAAYNIPGERRHSLLCAGYRNETNAVIRPSSSAGFQDKRKPPTYTDQGMASEEAITWTAGQQLMCRASREVPPHEERHMKVTSKFA